MHSSSSKSSSAAIAMDDTPEENDWLNIKEGNQYELNIQNQVLTQASVLSSTS